VLECDLAITADTDEHYDAFYKSGTRFQIGDDCYLKSAKKKPYLGKIDKVYKRDKSEVLLRVQVRRI
jgi:hypothetical protein